MRARWLLGPALLALLALRVGAVFTANVHWDEFAVLDQADRTHETGTLESGGRPGLATVVMLPFVADCDDEIAVIRRVRLLWTLFSFAFVAGVAVWIAQLEPERPTRWRDAALAAALLSLVPAFLETSLQVRTDQIALAGGVWGGTALLASRRRPWLALASGAILAVGLLSSQKLVYVAALALLLAAGQLWLARELRPRREALRALLCLAGFGLVVFGFRVWVGQAFELPARSQAGKPVTAAAIESGLSIFEFYRHTIGYSQYRELLPTLAPHGLLLVGLVAASVAAARGRLDGRRRLALAWAVLLLGAAVGLFHAAAFRYFWMTLGLFPAVALALARTPILGLAWLQPPRVRRLAIVGFWALLATPGLMQMGFLLSDAQAVQRESLGFVHRSFDRSARGFHPESGLFCQAGVQPLPIFFSQHIYRRFAGPDREANASRLIQAFADTPIEFILQSFRLNQFPVEVRRFWAANYQPYRGSVFVAGRRLEGRRGAREPFDVIVPGRYRWLPSSGPQPLDIDGRLLRPGGVVTLDRGAYTAHFVEDVPDGMLVLAVDEPPGRAPLPFYR